MEREIDRHLRAADDALAAGEPYETVMSSIAAAAALPGAEGYAIGIAEHRLTAALVYERSSAECEQALDDYLAVQPDRWRRALSTLSAGRTYPELARIRLPEQIPELETAEPTEAIAHVLEAAYRFMATVEHSR